MPSTPQDYSAPSAPILGGAEVPVMSAGDSYTPDFDFFTNISYPCGFPPMADPFVAPEFGTA